MLRFDRPKHGGSLVGARVRDIAGANAKGGPITLAADIIDDIGHVKATFHLMLAEDLCVGLEENPEPGHYLAWFRTVSRQSPGSRGLVVALLRDSKPPYSAGMMDQVASLLVELGLLPAGVIS